MGMSHLLAMISLPKRNEASASGPFFREASRWFNNPLIRPGKISWRMGYVAFGGGCGPLDLWNIMKSGFMKGSCYMGIPWQDLISWRYWGIGELRIKFSWCFVAWCNEKGLETTWSQARKMYSSRLLTEQRWPKMKGLHILTIFFATKISYTSGN